MIPLNDTVKVYKAGKKDSWGISQINTEPEILKCMVSEVVELIELKTVSGKAVNVTANIVFKGKADIKVGDNINTDNGKFEVLKVQYIKDLSSKILFTKVAV